MNQTIMRNELVNLGGGAFAIAFQILGNRDDAADAVQDSIVTVLGSPRAYDSQRGALKPWFFRVVRNRALDSLKQRKVSVQPSDELLDPAPGPQASAEQTERDSVLWGALMGMSIEHREMVVLRDYLGLSYAEIADVLGIAAGTVMSRIHRARLALRDSLQNDGGLL